MDVDVYWRNGRAMDEPTALRETAAHAGLPAATIDAALADAGAAQFLRQDVGPAIAAGAFGSPFVFVNGEPLFVVDSFELIEEWVGRGGGVSPSTEIAGQPASVSTQVSCIHSIYDSNFPSWGFPAGATRVGRGCRSRDKVPRSERSRSQSWRRYSTAARYNANALAVGGPGHLHLTFTVTL